jgi:Ni/Co efflux regulator RcnB
MIRSKKSMTAIAAALAMCMATSAFAQSEFGSNPTPSGPVRHGAQHRPPSPRAAYRPEARPQGQWRRGDRLPNEYRGRSYVVNDWRAHRLQPPPRGYQWVGVGADFVLVAVATGLIAQIIASH